MKCLLPFLLIAFFVVSCTSLYKTGQTPDDVYFSPAPPQDEYVQISGSDKQYYSAQNNYTINRSRFMLEDDYYSYNPSYYQYSNNFLLYNNSYLNNTWGNYCNWNYNFYNTYNPSYGHVVIFQPKTQTYNKPRMFNMNVYNPPSNNNVGSRFLGTSSPGSNATEKRSNTSPGNFLRNVFNNGGNQSFQVNNPNMSSNRSTSSPANTSGSGSRSTGGSAPVRHF